MSAKSRGSYCDIDDIITDSQNLTFMLEDTFGEVFGEELSADLKMPPTEQHFVAPLWLGVGMAREELVTVVRPKEFQMSTLLDVQTDTRTSPKEQCGHVHYYEVAEKLSTLAEFHDLPLRMRQVFAARFGDVLLKSHAWGSQLNVEFFKSLVHLEMILFMLNEASNRYFPVIH
ncbi:MAG: hypothetical protein MHM6MM_005863 [Cercozoa sp. M6MM]